MSQTESIPLLFESVSFTFKMLLISDNNILINIIQSEYRVRLWWNKLSRYFSAVPVYTTQLLYTHVCTKISGINCYMGLRRSIWGCRLVGAGMPVWRSAVSHAGLHVWVGKHGFEQHPAGWDPNYWSGYSTRAHNKTDKYMWDSQNRDHFNGLQSHATSQQN